MRRSRQRLAALLAAVATLGLVVVPAVHSELHVREAEAERQSALAIVFHLGFVHGRTGAQEQALEHAILHAFGDGEPEPGATSPDEPGPHRHSHGGPGAHGAGSLQHRGLALHAAARPPVVLQPSRLAESVFAAPLALFLTPRYSTPQNSQAPPAV